MSPALVQLILGLINGGLAVLGEVRAQGGLTDDQIADHVQTVTAGNDKQYDTLMAALAALPPAPSKVPLGGAAQAQAAAKTAPTPAPTPAHAVEQPASPPAKPPKASALGKPAAPSAPAEPPVEHAPLNSGPKPPIE